MVGCTTVIFGKPTTPPHRFAKYCANLISAGNNFNDFGV